MAHGVPLHQHKNPQARILSIAEEELRPSVLPPGVPSKQPVQVIVAGSVAMDLSCTYVSEDGASAAFTPKFSTSNPAAIKQGLGGVGQNIASVLNHLGVTVRLCSVVGKDITGSSDLGLLKQKGLGTDAIRISSTGRPTAQYVAINDSQKNLMVAMADRTILEEADEDFNATWLPHLEKYKPRWLVLDANWAPSTLRKWLKAAKEVGTKVMYEPVSVAKSKRLFSMDQGPTDLMAVPNHAISIATPNALELVAIHEAASEAGAFDRADWWERVENMGLPNSGSQDKLTSLTSSAFVEQGLPQQSLRLLPFIPCILTTLGEKGLLMTRLLQPEDDLLRSPEAAPYILTRSVDGNPVVGGVYMRLFNPAEQISPDYIASVNGAGDTLTGVIIAGLASNNPKPLHDIIGIAQKASVMTLKSADGVSPTIASLRSAL